MTVLENGKSCDIISSNYSYGFYFVCSLVLYIIGSQVPSDDDSMLVSAYNIINRIHATSKLSACSHEPLLCQNRIVKWEGVGDFGTIHPVSTRKIRIKVHINNGIDCCISAIYTGTVCFLKLTSSWDIF